MRKTILLLNLIGGLFCVKAIAQFDGVPTDWNVPDVEFFPEEMNSVSAVGHTLVDLNGDGYADLIDSEDNNSQFGNVWTNGLQRYWKVYLNNGTAISGTPTDWNVPDVEFNPEDMGSVNGDGHTLVDINGDGYPDLIDSEDNNSPFGIVWANGSQRYWKVYLNSGTAISATAVDWNVPDVEFNPEDMGSVNGVGHTLVDINGDGFPDLIDSEDNNSSNGSVWSNGSQRYWNVYLNNGTAFSQTPTVWNVPDVEFNAQDMGGVNGAGHTLVDLNGDGFPDLVDSKDNNSSFGNVWSNGLQRYWNVYLNNGTAISATATVWNVPDVEVNPEDMGTVNGASYALVDLNGDGFPDLVDSKDNNSSFGNVWSNGLQRYWKVYLNNGTAISATATDWNVPDVEFYPEDMATVFAVGHTLVDLDGDGLMDLVDSEDNNSQFGNVWSNGLQRYWKVYRNLSPTQVQEFESRNSILNVYPNPFTESFTVEFHELQKNVTITITDLVGKVIQTNTYRYSQSLGLTVEAPAGAYFMAVEGSAGKKVIIPLIKR